MFKKILIAIALVFSVVLTGCGKTENTNDTSQNNDKIVELEDRIQELEKENEKLKGERKQINQAASKMENNENPSANETKNQFENWKTYKNQSHKFTFKHPADWIVHDTLHSPGKGIKLSKKELKISVDSKSKLGNDINIMIDNISPKDILIKSDKKTINLNGKNFIRVKLKSNMESEAWMDSYSYFYEDNNNYFRFSVSDESDLKIVENILSTLEF